jgi:hypothetical protein
MSSPEWLDHRPRRSNAMPPIRQPKSKPPSKFQVITGKMSNLNQEFVAIGRK